MLDKESVECSRGLCRGNGAFNDFGGRGQYQRQRRTLALPNADLDWMAVDESFNNDPSIAESNNGPTTQILVPVVRDIDGNVFANVEGDG